MPLQNMVAIQTVTVGAGGASSISFTSIPQTYTDLCIAISVRMINTPGGTGGVWGNSSISFNGSTASQSARSLANADGTAASYNFPSGIFFWIPGANATASTYGNTQIYIPNYTSSNNKSISIDSVIENNGSQILNSMTAGLWSNSSAITSFSISPESGNYSQYSTATLYGVTNTIAGGAKAYGGTVTEDANYFYHTFLASGTFTPTANLSCDYLVVAGGGGGGKNWAGGGGAGGYRYLTSQSFTANTNYTVTVGAGGAGATTTTAQNAGSNSSFNSTSATGGGAGGNNQASPTSGGSGGGGAYTGEPGVSTNGAAGNAGSYSPVEGYAGGNGYNGSTRNSSAGGGGSSAVGANAVNDAAGAGGAGTSNSITGSAVTYAGGGGGGGYTPTGTYPAGAGGSGGGGAGGQGNGTTGTAGTANTGGGGGGGAGGNGNGGAGGSGIVIVRYAK